MPSSSDSHLKSFLSSQSEDAFRELVSEYGGLVYSSALRRTGEQELAEEITQTVFAILARKAASAARHPSLSAWLFTTTKLESSKAMRTRHRHQRKLAALADENPSDDAPKAWQDVLPHLDELLDNLPTLERQLLLSRYVDEKSYQILARESGKSEAACKMRIKRTLEKLRTALTTRGATVSITTLSLALNSELARAIPLSLSTSLPTQALATAATLNSGNLALTQVIHYMNTVKTSTIALAVIALGAIPISLQHASAVKLREELSVLQNQIPSAENRIRIRQKKEVEKATPIARLLAKSQAPVSGEGFLASLQKSMMNGGMAAMVKIIIPLSQADQAKIEALITEVEACQKFPNVKGAGLQMLLQISGESQNNPGRAMERTIASGLISQNLEGQMAQWLAQDEEAALAWFREKTAKGELVGNGLRDSPEAFIAKAIVRTLAKSDPEAALALVEEVDPLNRGEVIATLAPILTREGKGSWPQVRSLISSIKDLDERMQTTGGVVRNLSVKDREQVRLFLNGLNQSSMEKSHALAMAATVNIIDRPEPVSERMAWLVNSAPSPELHAAVKRAIHPLYRREAAEVTAWLDSLDHGPVRDAALDGFTYALREKRHFEKALRRAQSITDPGLREETTQRLLNSTMSVDPNAAARLQTLMNPASPKK